MWYRFIGICLAMLTLFALPEAHAQAYCKGGKNCIALLIANEDYNAELGALQSPASDAAVMAASLETLGFKTQIVTNGSRSETISALTAFTEQVRQADAYFVYYAGHALALPGNAGAAIVPVDAESYAATGFKEQLVSVETILSKLQSAQKTGAVGIFVFDACRTPLVGGSGKGTSGRDDWSAEAATGPSGLAAPQGTKELYVFYASADGSWTMDGGVFAKTLSAELESEGDLVRIFGRVREKVLVETNLGQDPELIISGVKGRPFCLLSCASPNLPAVDLDAVITAQSQGECTGEWQRPASGEPRYALVIGNNGYSGEGWRRLAQPARDADEIEKALTSVQFSAVKCHNLPRTKLIEMTERFRSFLEAEVQHWETTDGRVETKPSGFFYFSGHGASRSDAEAGPQDYMIPIDSDAASSADLIDKAVSLTRFTANLELIDANAIFVVFDACRNELDTKSGGVDKDYKARIVRRSGMLVAYATSLNTKARETSGYAASLASEIVQPGERATVAFEDAGIATDLKSNGEQIPVVESALRGPYWFVQN